jgi:glycosyltransferase involved in cell wall biosynthesis
MIFGPGDYGLPDSAALLSQDPRVRRLIQPCKWAADLYRSSCGDKILVWPVGIDTARWSDTAHERKEIDVLVYDKIRWDREREVPRVLNRTLEHLRRNGHSYAVLRYGEHYHGKFANLLRRSRSLLFLCEHETQGLACQQAMACNVPVLAWDEGKLVDPILMRFAASDLRVSSVPYFDASCGERFVLANFEITFAMFWSKLARYRPREFILDNLSLSKSGRAYLSVYESDM